MILDIEKTSKKTEFEKTKENYEIDFFWNNPDLEGVDESTLGILADKGMRKIDAGEKPETKCIVVKLSSNVPAEKYPAKYNGFKVVYKKE